MIKQLNQKQFIKPCAVCPNGKFRSSVRYCALTNVQMSMMIRGQDMAPTVHTASVYNKNKPPVFKIIEGTKPYPTLMNRFRVLRTVKPDELPKILSIRDAYKIVGR